VTLLERLLPFQDIDALLGDIEEESRCRSTLWFWGQVVAAVVVGSYREVRRHPLVALRAVGVGLLTLIVVFAPASRLLNVVRVLSEGGYYAGPYWLTLPPNAFRYLPALVNVLGFAASGWMIDLLDHFARHGRLVLRTGPNVAGVLSTLSLPAWVVLGGVLGLRPRT